MIKRYNRHRNSRKDGNILAVLKVENLTKRYPGVIALDNVTFEIEAGEVRGLIGENGAGKSTIIKSIAGAIAFEEGKLIINGKEYTSITPTEAIENGISVIYQEFNLVSSMTVAENIFLGEKIGGKYSANFREMERRSKVIFDRFGVSIDVKGFPRM